MRAVICSGVTLTVLILAGGTEPALARTVRECQAEYNRRMDDCAKYHPYPSQQYDACVGQSGLYFMDCMNVASDKKGGSKNAPVGTTGTSTPGGIHRPPRVPQHGEHY